MILCYCCERRFPTSADEIMAPCSCADDFCAYCFLCIHHCKCGGGESECNPFIVIHHRPDDADGEPFA